MRQQDGVTLLELRAEACNILERIGMSSARLLLLRGELSDLIRSVDRISVYKWFSDEWFSIP